MSPAKDVDSNEQRKSADFVTVDAVPSPFKSTISTSETSQLRNFSVSAEDYTSDRKKLDAQVDTKISRPSEYQEDLTISSVKTDFGGMLDMTTLHKKQQSSQSADMGDSLNLSKDR